MKPVRKIIGCGLPIFLSGSVAFGYPGLMSAYWQSAYNVSVAETSLVVTFMLLALACAMFISGRVHKKLGMAYCVVISTAIYIVAFAVLITAKTMAQVYVWAFLSNVGCSFAYGPGSTTGQNALPQKRGLVSGILNLAFGVAAAVTTPFLNKVLDVKGYLFVNILVLAVIIVGNTIAFILLKTSGDDRVSAKGGKPPINNLTVVEALKTREFWTIWLIWATVGAAGVSMLSLSKTYAMYLGVGGVTILTAFNLANGISRIFVGILSDKIGGKATSILASILAALGYYLMLVFSSVNGVAICSIGVGIAFGTLFTVYAPLCANLFGMEHFGMIYGLIFTGYGLAGGIVGPAISGKILAATNNDYRIVFIYLGAMAVIGTLLTVSLKAKRKYEKVAKN